MRNIRYLKKPFKTVANRRKDERRLSLIFIVLILLFSSILFFFVPKALPTKSLIHHEGQLALKNVGRKMLIKKSLTEITINSDDKSQISIAFEFPKKENDKTLKKFVKSQLTHSGLSISKISNLTMNKGFIVYVDYYSEPVGFIAFIKGKAFTDLQLIRGDLKYKPKLVVIIDDFGYSNNDVIKGFLRLNVNITLSVIPGHEYSRWTASEGKKNNKEIIIHMPMEPEDQNYAVGEEQYLLKHTLRSYEVEQRINSAYMELPEAIGMNNHMGSLATSDEDLMKMVAKSLQKKGLYFIDSLTSPRSIAYEVAREVGIPTAVRTVFLDNKREKSEIQAQFKKAIEVAKRSGKAIAIGHVNLQTLETFKEMIEQGFFSEVSFSFASEVVS